MARRGPGCPCVLVLQVKVTRQPACLSQTAGSSGALQEFAPLQCHAVVRRFEVRRPGDVPSWPTYYSVCEAEVPQGQALVAWRGGRGSSVTLILGRGGDTIHWMQVEIKKKKGGDGPKKRGGGRGMRSERRRRKGRQGEGGRVCRG